jgi:hypothetical protein
MLNVNIDLKAIENIYNIDVIRKAGNDAAHKLTLLTQAKIEELASERLHSRLQMFREGMSIKQEDEGVYIIHLDEKLTWIEEGLQAHSMIPDFMQSPKCKIAADGHRYLVVPFKNKVGSSYTNTTPVQMSLVNAIKDKLKKDKIPWSKIEKDDQGRPKIGMLHKVQIKTPEKFREGSGMGHGPIGSERQGWTGKPFLEGASLYQNKTSSGKIERGVITFRVASEKQLGSEMWTHPGLHASNILEDAYKWALNELEKNIMPEVIKQIEEASKSLL